MGWGCKGKTKIREYDNVLGFFSVYFVFNVIFVPFNVGDETVRVTLPALRILRRMHCI